MKKTLFAALMTTVFLPCLVRAAEVTVDLNLQKNLNMIIYNNDLALVKDTRSVPMTLGSNEVAFAGISGQIIPSSVVLEGKGITFLENNFNFDVLSYESLLQKSIGQTVTAEYLNPKSGVLETTSAELLAINNGRPILRINGKIDASFPGYVVFHHLPTNLRVEPTLVMNVAAKQQGKQDLTLNYLTHGLSWNASYVAQLSADNKSMTLDGWVSLTNNSGMDYKDTHMQVVAGDVHVTSERPKMVYKRALGASFADTLSENSVMLEENVADYHMYTLPRTTTILNNQTKQVSLLSANNVGVQKEYTFKNLQTNQEIKNVKPNITVRFTNKKENQLGIALPRGTVRLYQADSKGNLIFVGEDRINHVGNLEEVTLNMGTAFDISANAKLTDQRSWSESRPNRNAVRVHEKTYEITVKNGNTFPTKVNIEEHFYGQHVKITAETLPSEKIMDATYRWKLDLPAEGEVKISYTVVWEE